MSDNIKSAIAPSYTLKFMTHENEGTYFDRKKASIDVKDIAKHISAFANANGGVIAIGIEDDGTISGINHVGSDKINKFEKAYLQLCAPSPLCKSEKLAVTNKDGNDDFILLLHIEPSKNSIVYTTRHEAYLRSGDSSIELNHNQITNLEYDKGVRLFEDEIIDRASADDLDAKLLASYKSILNTDQPDLDVLRSRGLMYNGKLTVAGVLLFCQNPDIYLPQAFIKYTRYDGTEARTGENINIIKEDRIYGSIPIVIDKIKTLVKSN